jgi:hypothetical protein
MSANKRSDTEVQRQERMNSVEKGIAGELNRLFVIMDTREQARQTTHIAHPKTPLRDNQCQRDAKKNTAGDAQ